MLYKPLLYGLPVHDRNGVFWFIIELPVFFDRSFNERCSIKSGKCRSFLPEFFLISREGWTCKRRIEKFRLNAYQVNSSFSKSSSTSLLAEHEKEIRLRLCWPRRPPCIQCIWLQSLLVGQKIDFWNSQSHMTWPLRKDLAFLFILQERNPGEAQWKKSNAIWLSIISYFHSSNNLPNPMSSHIWLNIISLTLNFQVWFIWQQYHISLFEKFRGEIFNLNSALNNQLSVILFLCELLINLKIKWPTEEPFYY